MARLAGLEPATLGLEGRCSIQLSYRRLTFAVFPSGKIDRRKVIGRGREIRTPDILLPKQARYQTALYPVFSPIWEDEIIRRGRVYVNYYDARKAEFLQLIVDFLSAVYGSYFYRAKFELRANR